MNKFITNPHWLKPGDVITLLEYKREEKSRGLEVSKPTEAAPALEKPKEIRGINVESLTNVEALGFLRQTPVESWGRIFDLEAQKVLIEEKDIVYVKMNKEGIKPGDKFTVYDLSEPIGDPVTKEECGYLHSFKGVLMIEEAKKGYHVASVQESYRSIHKDDLLLPYHPVSPCVLPLPYQGDLSCRVIAGKENLNLHGQYSVVYLDRGFQQGVRRGNIFEVIEVRESNIGEKQSVALPPVVLARILVLATTNQTSAGVVFQSPRNFGNGVKTRPAQWQTEFRGLASLPTCRID